MPHPTQVLLSGSPSLSIILPKDNKKKDERSNVLQKIRMTGYFYSKYCPGRISKGEKSFNTKVLPSTEVNLIFKSKSFFARIIVILVIQIIQINKHNIFNNQDIFFVFFCVQELSLPSLWWPSKGLFFF